MAKVINSEILGPFRQDDISATLNRFNIIKSMKFLANGYRIDLLLSLRSGEDIKKLKVRFNRVNGFESGDLSPGNFDPAHLAAYDISNRGMEGINWSIDNHESYSFQFYCETIEFISATLTSSQE